MVHSTAGMHRRSIRLPLYDYTQPGVYFVTICAWHRECLFGTVIDSEVALNAFGEIVRDEWLRTPTVRPYVALDAFVVMPNHLHGILEITPHEEVSALCGSVAARAGTASGSNLATCRRGTAPPCPYPGGEVRRFGQTVAGSLATIVGACKSVTTRRINLLRDTPGAPVWQRNYYERVIRKQRELAAIRTYIEANPGHWQEDRENPEARPPRSWGNAL